MVADLGMKRIAYDWRDEHVASFEEEILQYKKHGIEFFAFWSWHPDMEPLIRKHKIHPQIWMMFAALDNGTQEEKTQAAANSLLPVAGVTLGVAQAAALVPGVSRNGATLIAARRRGFNREQANLLSRTVALPVIAGAAMLKGERLRRRGVDRGLRRSLMIGTLTAFVSTLASQRLLRLVEKDRALWPYALYRLGLAGVVLRRLFRLNQVYD